MIYTHSSHDEFHYHFHDVHHFPQWGGGKKCARCGKTVYANEEIIAAGESWHKRGCFTCKECGK